MYEANFLHTGLPVHSTDQDSSRCDTYFDDFITPNGINNNGPSIGQLPTTTSYEFEQFAAAQFANNNLAAANLFDAFQYSFPSARNTIFTQEILNSPASFLNSYNIPKYDCPITTPQNFPSMQSFDVSPTGTTMTELSACSSSVEEPFDQQINTKIDPLMTQNENMNKRVSVEHESNLQGRSLKKKRKSTGGIAKSIPKSLDGLKPSATRYTKNDPISENHSSYNEETTCINGLNMGSNIQTIAAQNSLMVNADIPPYVPDVFNQPSWPETANQNFIPNVMNSNRITDTTQFHNIPMLPSARDAANSTGKVAITRLKPPPSTVSSLPHSQIQTNKQQKKVAHNAIERRYRNNINDRINELKNVVPALNHLKHKDTKDEEDDNEVDGIQAATKLNKATILRKSTEYITYLKNNNKKIKNENEVLRKMIEALPGGIELFNAYNIKKMAVESVGTPSDTSEDVDSDPPGSASPNHEEFDYLPPTPPSSVNTGSRAMMALFMCMTFFTSSSYDQYTSHHHSEGRVMSSNESPINNKSEIPKGTYNSNDGTITINIWYFARIFAFIMCLAYILRPSLFSSQPRIIRKSKSVIISVLTAKTKDATALYLSLSRLSYRSPMNTFELLVGLFTESLKFISRRLLGWEIPSSFANIDLDERLWEVGLWARLGEVELCGGNKKASRLSILYTCLRTINLLEHPYTIHKNLYISSSRIYANAAIQCYIGLHSIPFLSRKIVSSFWQLAIKGKRRCGSDEKWFEIALISDSNSDMWKGVVNRISDHALRSSKTDEIISTMRNTTIPLIHVSDAQAFIHLKETFSNFVSMRYGNKKNAKKSKFTFVELLSVTTPASLTHWYALVGCAVQAFSEGKHAHGEKFVNKLREEFQKTDKSLNKQIITMGLLSYILLIYGKVEASVRCADKASTSVTLRRKEEKTGIIEDGSSDKDLEFRKTEYDVHILAEFCVGWVVLEARIFGWKKIEGLSLENKDEVLPGVLDVEARLKPSIDSWIRYLRRLSKADVFDKIPKAREEFIKSLETLGRIVGGLDDSVDLINCYDDNTNNEGNWADQNDDNRAVRAWNALKGMYNIPQMG
ncbi:sterol regulatory element binding protein, transcription factor sre1 [Gigaspora margarita]|uniref:Sterol regulatory element binding protein, transcription factor sre1 n=2 Tax=Gigaspora margarita TaxID=4874 RepID=A0A8H3X8S9_GIGMA|nr:sterol regulatory element binding protein, transcription factor sre1 [Gigaspora margarita]